MIRLRKLVVHVSIKLRVLYDVECVFVCAYMSK